MAIQYRVDIHQIYTYIVLMFTLRRSSQNLHPTYWDEQEVGGLMQVSMVSIPALVLVWDRYQHDRIGTLFLSSDRDRLRATALCKTRFCSVIDEVRQDCYFLFFLNSVKLLSDTPLCVEKHWSSTYFTHIFMHQKLSPCPGAPSYSDHQASFKDKICCI